MLRYIAIAISALALGLAGGAPVERNHLISQLKQEPVVYVSASASREPRLFDDCVKAGGKTQRVDAFGTGVVCSVQYINAYHVEDLLGFERSE